MTAAVVQAAAAEAPELDQVQQQVSEWLRFDRDDASRAQVQAMLDNQAQKELKELMCQRLEFGKHLVIQEQGSAEPAGQAQQWIAAAACWVSAAMSAVAVLWQQPLAVDPQGLLVWQVPNSWTLPATLSPNVSPGD